MGMMRSNGICGWVPVLESMRCKEEKRREEMTGGEKMMKENGERG